MIEDFENKVFYIGKTNFRNQKQPFGIKLKDRRSHMYLIGKTGMGKSTLLKNLLLQDLKNGSGLALLDPHGDLVEEIFARIPKEREKDVTYINPADSLSSLGFNVLEGIDTPRGRHLIASGLVSVFKKLWSEFWGPRSEHILRNSILALTEYPGTTLLDLPRLLTDKNFRKIVLTYVRDPLVKEFWQKEFTSYPPRLRAEAIAPIQNKAGAFLGSPFIKDIIGKKRSSFNIREIMDTGKILLVNLSKGKIGEETSTLLGALLITKIELAALSRADTPEKKRKDFFLYIDEFHTFTTTSFADMLPESRKHRLSLILAHQFIEQLDERIAAAIFGNAGTIVSFRVGARDAEYLAKEFHPYFKREDLIHLPTYYIYIKLMINGVTSMPFSAETLPPIK